MTGSIETKNKIITGQPSMQTGFSLMTNTYFRTPYLRRIGNVVEMDIQICCDNNVPTDFNTVIAYLPKQFRTDKNYMGFGIFLGTSNSGRL